MASGAWFALVHRMRSAFVFIASLLVACTTRVERTDRIMVPLTTSPCTLGEACPDGTDVDPNHDHLDQWRSLPCEQACKLLLRAPTRTVDINDPTSHEGPAWWNDPGSRNPDTIDACQAIQWENGSGVVDTSYEEPGAWVISCTYPYDEPPPQELM